MAAGDRAEGGSAYLEERHRKAAGAARIPIALPAAAVTTRDVKWLRDLVRYVGANAGGDARRPSLDVMQGWHAGWAAACAWVEKELDRLVGEVGGKGEGA